MIRKIREAQEREEGFTLIELLVVVIIIGILAAIAIPVFLNQREKAFKSAVKADLRNAATQLESHYTDSFDYRTYNGGSVQNLASDGVELFPGGTAANLQSAPSGNAAINQAAYCLEGSHAGLDGTDTDHWFYIVSNANSDSAKVVAGKCPTP